MAKNLCYMTQLPDSRIEFCAFLNAGKPYLSVDGIEEDYELSRLCIVENPKSQFPGYYICEDANVVLSLEELTLRDITALAHHFSLAIHHDSNHIYAMESRMYTDILKLDC